MWEKEESEKRERVGEKGKGKGRNGRSKARLHRREGKEEGQFENTEINGGKDQWARRFHFQVLKAKHLVEVVQSELDLQKQLEMPEDGKEKIHH